MSNQLSRQLQILLVLPEYPKYRTTNQLAEILRNQGFKFVKETIQRDITKLCDAFPRMIAKESYDDFRERTGKELDDDKSQHVFWEKNTKPIDIAGLTVNQAFSFSLLKKFLVPLIPQTTLDELEPFFDEAENTLKNVDERNRVRKWQDKIAVIYPTQPILPPVVDPKIHEAVSEALLYDHQLKINYRRVDGVVNEYHLNPLGLVLRNGSCYLIATKAETNEKRIFALHRMRDAIQLDVEVEHLEECDLQRFIDEGGMGFDLTGGGSYQPIRLKAIFDPITANHLSESRLSDDQVVTKLDDDHYEITATVRETEQLYWWLLSFGSRVEVLEPPALRAKIIDTVKALAEKYQVDTQN